MTRSFIRMLLVVGILVGMLVSGLAHADETFRVQVCSGKGKAKHCHVEKKEKISDSVTYLDMSQVEGKVSEFPEIASKGKL